MRLPIRLLNIARCSDPDARRFNLGRMKLERIDGHNVAMATDGFSAIVSATKTEEKMPGRDAISRKDAKLAIDMAFLIGAETAEVSSQYICVGQTEICLEPTEGRFPNILNESIWSTLNDDKSVSVVVDIKRLRQLLEILSDAMPDDPQQFMVMTVPAENNTAIVFTSESCGELMAGALYPARESNVPAWNPSELTPKQEQASTAADSASL